MDNETVETSKETLKSGTEERDYWGKMEQRAKVFSLIAVPVVLAVGGWMVQKAIESEKVSKDYVSLAISLLDDNKKVDSSLKQWAVDILNKKSPVPLNKGVSNRLVTGELHLRESLDGRFEFIRAKQTNLTMIIGDAFLRAAPNAEVSIYNSGMIRIDAALPANKLSLNMIDNILPFNNTLVLVELRGETLKRVLDQGAKNVGLGGYLQTRNVTFDNGWKISGSPLISNVTYKVVINDFLLTGGEVGLGFLENGSEVRKIREIGSCREALINEFLSRTEIQ